MSMKIILFFSIFNFIYLGNYFNSLKFSTCGAGIITNPDLIENSKPIAIDTDFSPIRIFIDYTQFELDCTQFTNITKSKSLIKERLSKAATLMEKIINVQRFTEKINLNDDLLSSLSLSNYDQTLLTGVSYDLIVYPTIRNFLKKVIDFEEKIVTFNGYPLLIEPTTKRPILGKIEIFNIDYSKMDNCEEFFLNSFIHQLMHIMVFDEKLIKKFPGYTKSSPPYIRRLDYTSQREFNYIVTPKVLYFARRHFNSPKMIGLQMDYNVYIYENNMYHWTQRFMAGDIMVADFYEEQAISEMTLGLFEDSNWYKVNYYTGGLFRFGKNETKYFTDLKCFNYFDYFSNNDFCTEEYERRCTGGRLNKGVCKFYINQAIPSFFQYFSNNSTKGGRPNVEYCPITQSENDTLSQNYNFYPGHCQHGLVFKYGLGEVFTGHSFCAISDVVPKNKGLEKYNVSRSVCYPMYCSDTTLTIQISDFYVTCPREGGVIALPSYSNYLGSVECPDYNLICTGTVVCNNIEDCIEKQSVVKNSSFVYEGFTYSKQSLNNLYYYNIKSKGEGSDDGVCGKNCLFCTKNISCLECRERYYMGSKNNNKEDTTHLFCDVEEEFTDDKYEFYDGIYYFIGKNNNIAYGKNENNNNFIQSGNNDINTRKQEESVNEKNENEMLNYSNYNFILNVLFFILLIIS